jgi:zinc protease
LPLAVAIQNVRSPRISRPLAICLALTLLLGALPERRFAASVKLPHSSIHQLALSNGLRALLVENHDVPVVSVEVWYHVGSKDEEPGKTGFAHLFEHLMYQGTKN